MSRDKYISVFKTMTYLWLSLFLILPFFLILTISLSFQNENLLPYQSIISWHGVFPTFNLSLKNFFRIIINPVYIKSFFYTIRISLVATIMCLIVSYPIAYAVYRTDYKKQNLLLLIITVPSLLPSLIRIYSLMEIIRKNGIINNLLIKLSVIKEPLRILYTDLSVYLGIIYIYLPFMVLPIYLSLQRIDTRIINAAKDLGANSFQVFTRITLPLSLPGIITGSVLIFVAAFGEFTIPNIIGSPNNLMLSNLIWDIFFINRDWPTAAMITIIIFSLLAPPIIWIQNSFGKVF